MKNFKLRRGLLLAALILCAAVLLTAGVTLAYFTAESDWKDNFTFGQVDIALAEVFDEADSVLIPGQAVNRDVWVRNDGSTAAWVRVKVYVPAAVDGLEAEAADAVHVRLLPGAEEAWNVQNALSEAKMVSEGEYAGYNEYIFHYNTALKAGETTLQLLDDVCLDAAVSFDKASGKYFRMIDGEVAEVDLSNLNIIVTAEAIQAAGFETWTTAFEAFDMQAAQ